ncbi:MAG: arginine--tRNA ligase, partial [bacterium]|nr:arginine--tRNA ligase [bacterium]
MEEQIRKAVDVALAKMGAGEVAFVVERPSDMQYGDYTTNAALAAAKTLGKNPKEVADELARFLIDELGKDIASHVAVAGPGFVNITLSHEAVGLAVAEADAKGTEWGKGSVNVGKHIMIEYTDPNPFKEMHIGHLMSNAIGESIARLLEAS